MGGGFCRRGLCVGAEVEVEAVVLSGLNVEFKLSCLITFFGDFDRVPTGFEREFTDGAGELCFFSDMNDRSLRLASHFKVANLLLEGAGIDQSRDREENDKYPEQLHFARSGWLFFERCRGGVT